MFGVIVASRPVITDLQAISQTQFAFSIPSQPAFSHIVVFILPGNSLPEGTAAGVYLQVPSSSEFKLLGAIANEKQSAIFRINIHDHEGNNASAAAFDVGDDVMIDDSNSQPVSSSLTAGPMPNIVIGISIEPTATIQTQLSAMKSDEKSLQNAGQGIVKYETRKVPTKILAKRIIENAFNFLSSFAAGPGGNESIPLKAFQNWWTKFEKRIELDPTFLEKGDVS